MDPLSVSLIGFAAILILAFLRFPLALAMGLVNEVVPVDALASAVEEICARIAENAPLSIRASKLTIDELSKGRRDLDHDLIRSLIIDCFDSEDYQEGRTAFMEKRKPVFQGC